MKKKNVKVLSGRKRIEKLLAEDALMMRAQGKSCWDSKNIMTKPMMKLMSAADKEAKQNKKKNKKNKKNKKTKG